MEIFVALALYTIVAGSFLYLLFCVDPNKTGMLSNFSRFFFNRVPGFIGYIENKIL